MPPIRLAAVAFSAFSGAKFLPRHVWGFFMTEA